MIVNFVEGRSVVKLGKKIHDPLGGPDQSGRRCQASDLPQGKVRIQVIAKNYQTFGETFELDAAEKTIVIKLNPPQQQYSAHQ